MPCDIAVSIAKASVSDAFLRSLLTNAAMRDVVLHYLKQQYGTEAPELSDETPITLFYRVGDLALKIKAGGRVFVRGQVGDERTRTLLAQRAEKLSSQIATLLQLTADRLLQQKVQQFLGPRATQQVTEVDNDGVRQQAVVFTLKI